MNFESQLFVGRLPQPDDVISLWTGPDESRLPPSWEGSDSDYILLAGVDESAVNAFMAEASRRGQELADFYRGILPDELWDVRIKPIILFGAVEPALEFDDLLSALDGDEQADILSELQLSYNEPWTKVTLISPDQWRDLKARYFSC